MGNMCGTAQQYTPDDDTINIVITIPPLLPNTNTVDPVSSKMKCLQTSLGLQHLQGQIELYKEQVTPKTKVIIVTLHSLDNSDIRKGNDFAGKSDESLLNSP